MSYYNPKRFNSEAPEGMHEYWMNLEDKPELEGIAANLLLNFIHERGFPQKHRMEVMAGVLNKIGYNAKVDKNPHWDVVVEPNDRYLLFLTALSKIPRGKMEYEINAIIELLEEYSVKPPPFWNRVFGCWKKKKLEKI